MGDNPTIGQREFSWNPNEGYAPGPGEKREIDAQVGASRGMIRGGLLSPEERALYYLTVLDLIIMGEDVPEEHAAFTIVGLQEDDEAKIALYEMTGEKPPSAVQIVQDIAAFDVNQAFQLRNVLQAEGQAFNEVWFDVAISALASVGTAGLFRAGMSASQFGLRATATAGPGRLFAQYSDEVAAAVKNSTSIQGTSIKPATQAMRFRSVITGKPVQQLLDEAAAKAVANPRVVASSRAAAGARGASGMAAEARAAGLETLTQAGGAGSYRFPWLATRLDRFRQSALGSFMTVNAVAGFGMLAVRTADMVANPEAYEEGDARALSLSLYGLDREEAQGLLDEEEAALLDVGPTKAKAAAMGLGGPVVPTAIQPETPQVGLAGPATPAPGIPQAPAYVIGHRDGRVEYDSAGNVVKIDMAAIESEEDLLNAQASIAAATAQEGNPLIGVPEGFLAETATGNQAFDSQRNTGPGNFDAGAAHSIFGTVAPGGQYGTPNVENTDSVVLVPAQYRQNDINSILFGMTPPQVEAFQRQAVRAGLLDDHAPGFVYGSADELTRQAMAVTMGNSNRLGRDWRSMIEIMGDEYQAYVQEVQNSNKPAKPLFVPSRAYTALDPETARQWFQNTVEGRLGRKASDWEVREMARYMEANHRENYDNQIAAEKSLWEARGRAAEGLDPGAIASYTEIDENARAEARFEEDYETELGEVDRWQQVKRDTQSLFQGLDSMSAQLGGV